MDCSPDVLPRASRASPWVDPPPKFSIFKSSATLPESAEIVVIGGGFSGVSVAYHILNSYPGINVVLLEAGQICSGATGRNGGHLRPDYYTYTEAAVKRFGEEDAIRLSNFERQNFEALSDLIEKEKINCEFDKNGQAWRVFLSEDEFQDDLRNLALMRDIGGNVEDVHVYQRDEARRITGIAGCYGAIASPASPISPTKLVSHLLEACMLSGLHLQTNTRVLNITNNVLSGSSSPSFKDPADDFIEIDQSLLRMSPSRKSFLYKLHTSNGAILANKVVHATNAYLDTLLSVSPHIASNICSDNLNVLVTPTRGHVCEVRLAGGRTKLSMDPSYNITNMNFNRGGDYLIQRPNGNLVFGGGRRFGKGLGYESFNTLTTAESEIDAAVDLHLRSFLTQSLGFDTGRYLRPLDCGNNDKPKSQFSEKIDLIREWTGIMGFSVDEYPLVGKVPSFVDESHEYCISGFTGHGMPRIFLAAKWLAQSILLDDRDYQYDQEYHSSAEMTQSFVSRKVERQVDMPFCFVMNEQRLKNMMELVKTKE
ncbi:FAD dependent oxidoreductase [Lipomyces oligophaga]|uniref:FAD dependent oxidoreductase n=1 Tax=Lipomyces oligophaga TaxID=45792 RepID=UPI0034CF57E3